MTQASQPLSIDALKPGDVLLHMGKGELSKLIAWVGDSEYSHAAMVVEGGQLIEAAAAGVRHAGLPERTRMVANFQFIDVYRPLRPDPGNDKDRAAMLASINTYLGRPYPMTSLFTLGIACAVRNKIPGDPAFREFVRVALDLVINNDSNQVVCSELVYRGFDEAATKPAHALRLKIITRPVQGTPLPRIDLAALLIESLDDYKRSRPQTRGHNPFEATAEHDEGDIDELVLQARAQLGLDASMRASKGDYAPNPKTILPADLQFSPGLTRLGRLAMRA